MQLVCHGFYICIAIMRPYLLLVAAEIYYIVLHILYILNVFIVL